MSSRRNQLQSLTFPGEESREVWTCEGDENWTLTPQGPPGVIGIEMLAFDSAPFWSLNHDEAPDEAVAMRWEGVGLEAAEGARLWTHWEVAQMQGRTLVGTVALVDEPQAGKELRFEPSVRMLPLPPNSLVIWKELGRLTVAFTRGIHLLHVTVLAGRRLDADAAFELRDVFLVLQMHGYLTKLDAIHVWTEGESDFAPQLACLFEDVTVVKEPRPDPRLPGTSSDLLPAGVAAMKKTRESRARQLMIFAMAALLYVSFFGAWWLGIEWRGSRIEAENERLTLLQPQVDAVREAQTRWYEMEPAIEPDLYPVEVFHQVVALLPPEGIRLKEFQMDNGKLVIAGEATSVNHALGFKDKLAACAPLQRYTWNFPVPRIRDEDNRAEFRAVGNIDGEGAQ